jgi:site-specific DNA-methyltransferase (adenine-specific)
MWVYGSGFPKSHNIGNGWGTALKPACEPIVLARKPLSEKTVAANVLEWGTGAINVDGCRVAAEDGANFARPVNHTGIHEGWDRPWKATLGRWPANLIHDGSAEVLAGFPETAKSTDRPRNNGAFDSVAKGHDYPHTTFGHNDSGSAARFFYCAKASKAERLGSKHPTVKPLKLMQYLIRLVTPPGGTVLDPFAGSGTTGQAALNEGCHAILIEREPEYQIDIQRRLESGPLFMTG